MGRFDEVGKVLNYWELEKSRRKIARVVVHCSATPQGRYHDAHDIHRWHKEPPNNWAGVGYHYILLDSGEIQQGRNIHYQGVHAKGYNVGSLAICLIGGLNDDMIATDNAFTLDQILRLESVLKELRKMYPDADILGHRDLPNVNKACPCLNVSNYI